MKGFIALLIVGVGVILFVMGHPIIAVGSWFFAGLITETKTAQGFIVLLIIGVGVRLFATGHPIIAVGSWLVAGCLASAERVDGKYFGGGGGNPGDCAGTPGCY